MRIEKANLKQVKWEVVKKESWLYNKKEWREND
jgi:hypothetical protein